MPKVNSNYVSTGTRIKTSLSNTYNKAKTYVSDTYNSVKTSTKEYKQHIGTAYNVGYKSGVRDYSRIPKVFGAGSSATSGYSKALVDARRNEKYKNKLKNL